MKIKKLNHLVSRQISSLKYIKNHIHIIKELIENSLDGRATKISINLIKKDDKMEIIVSDNGTGINGDIGEWCSSKNYYTTKTDGMNIQSNEINESNTQSYGYKGIFLISLSDICDLEIRTRTKNENLGRKITFGEMKKQIIEPTPAQIGTTVHLKEIKKESSLNHNHLLQLIKKFCKFNSVFFEVQKNGKIVHSEKGKSFVQFINEFEMIPTETCHFEQTVFGTFKIYFQQKNTKITQNGIFKGLTPQKTNLFGKSRNKNLLHDEPKMAEVSLLLVNNRPVTCSTLQRQISSICSSNFISCVFVIVLENINYDILSIDKEDVIIDDAIIEKIVKRIESWVFEGRKVLPKRKPSVDLKEILSLPNSNEKDVKRNTQQSELLKNSSHISQYDSFAEKTPFNTDSIILSSPKSTLGSEIDRSPQNVLADKTNKIENKQTKNNNFESVQELFEVSQSQTFNNSNQIYEDESNLSVKLSKNNSSEFYQPEYSPAYQIDKVLQKGIKNEIQNKMRLNAEKMHLKRKSNEQVSAFDDYEWPINSFEPLVEHKKAKNSPTKASNKPQIDVSYLFGTDSQSLVPQQNNQPIEENRDEIITNETQTPEESATFEDSFLDFPLSFSKLSDFTLKKHHFKELKIIGQFNQGFILTQLTYKERKLLIIFDQHACDEIYNYEQLFKTTKIANQCLLKPIKIKNDGSETNEYLETVPVVGNKTLNVIDHVFSSDRDEHSGNLQSTAFTEEFEKVHCLSSEFEFADKSSNSIKNTNKEVLLRDKSEVDGELAHLLATKACRMSIMIGDKLNFDKMSKIIRNLGQLERPWNCPHGRPTFFVLGHV